MNAQEAKTTAENVLKSHADKVYEKIEKAANAGSFYVTVETSGMNNQVLKILEDDGFKVEYGPGNSNDRFSIPYYKISWK